MKWTMTSGARIVALLAISLAPLAGLRAQQRPEQRAPAPRRQPTIEIRGQVPTPQVVTVRPREAPDYSRRVLVPAFFDRDFWPSILLPLEILTPASAVRADSLRPPPADSTRRVQPGGARPPSGMRPAPPPASEP